MNKLRLRLLSLAYSDLRGQRAKVEHEIGQLSRELKKIGKRKIKCKGFTLFIDDASRTTLPRQAVVDKMGENWVRAHEKTSRFRVIRIVRDK